MVRTMTPPITRRYCLTCNEITHFKYNQAIGHSECTKCYNRWAISIQQYEQIKNHYKIKEIELKKQIEELRIKNRKLGQHISNCSARIRQLKEVKYKGEVQK